MAAASADDPESLEKLSGLIERVTYFNEETGFAVLRVKASGHRDLVTVVGSLPSASAGEWLTAAGTWVRDREHGLQLKATAIRAVPPTTKEGIERYLGSGMVKGIGPVFAKRMVERFGADILSVIEERSGELEQVDGIGQKRRLRIKQVWEEGKRAPEIMLFLHGHGVSTSKAVRIYRTYGDQAIERVRGNPYVLAKDLKMASADLGGSAPTSWNPVWGGVRMGGARPRLSDVQLAQVAVNVAAPAAMRNLGQKSSPRRCLRVVTDLAETHLFHT